MAEMERDEVKRGIKTDGEGRREAVGKMGNGREEVGRGRAGKKGGK